MYPEQASSFPKLYLAGGVTTIRTTGSDRAYTDLELKQAIDAGKIAGPKMHITGPYLEGVGSFIAAVARAGRRRRRARHRRLLDRRRRDLVQGLHAHHPRRTRRAIAAAHAQHIKVTGHLCSIGFREAADLGIDNLEHGFVVDTEFAAGQAARRLSGHHGSRRRTWRR